MQSKKKYKILVCVLVIFFIYLSFYLIYSEKNKNSNLIDKEKYTKAFYSENESDELKDLVNQLDYVSNKINTGVGQEEKFKKIYEQSLKIYSNEKLENRDRAYAINILASTYLYQDFNSLIFIDEIKKYPKIYSVYNSYLKETTKYKMSDNPGFSSFLYNINTPNINYATQKTIFYLENEAYKLYPNSYSLLRGMMNSIQADGILYSNYNLKDKYKNISEFYKKRYSPEYINDLGNKINKFKNDDTLYNNLYASAYEIDVAIANGYLYHLKYLPTKFDNSFNSDELNKDILRQINVEADKIIYVAEKYNSPKRSFSQSISALTKAQVVMENKLSEEENEKILNETILILKKLIVAQHKGETIVWLSKLPEKSVLFLRLQYLMEKDEFIKKYVNGIRDK